MIVMLRSEECDVDKAHGCAQARMARGAFESRPVRPIQNRDELKPKGAEPLEQIIERSRVMVRFIRAAIGQIGNGELAPPLQQLLCAPDPERLQVTEVADVLLDRPRVVETRGERGGRERANAFFNPCRAPAESLQDVRKAREGEVERELSFKPGLQGTHLLQDRK